MKKLTITILIACIAMVFTGCKKENSKFDLDSVQGKATLSGLVYYNPGYNLNASGNPELKNNAAVSGKTVYINLKKDGNVIKTYQATTNSAGKFSIQLPASDNIVFQADAYVNYSGTYDNAKHTTAWVIYQQTGVYKGNATTVSLKPNNEHVVTIKANFTDNSDIPAI